jgi:hypothetical protein
MNGHCGPEEEITRVLRDVSPSQSIVNRSCVIEDKKRIWLLMLLSERPFVLGLRYVERRIRLECVERYK